MKQYSNTKSFNLNETNESRYNQQSHSGVYDIKRYVLNVWMFEYSSWINKMIIRNEALIFFIIIYFDVFILIHMQFIKFSNLNYLFLYLVNLSYKIIIFYVIFIVK